MTKIIYDKDKNKVDEIGIGIVKKILTEVVESKGKAVMAIPGGRSVQGMFKLFSTEKGIPWKHVHIFMVDERIVSIDNDNSNFKLAKKLFIDNLSSEKRISEKNIHPFLMDVRKEDYGVSDYGEELETYGGLFDLILLGVGEDGHVGALFPDHHSIKDNSDYFIVMKDSPKAPPLRMTSSRKLLLRSSTALAFVYNKEKKNAFEKFFYNVTHERLPLAMIKDIEKSYLLTNIES